MDWLKERLAGLRESFTSIAGGGGTETADESVYGGGGYGGGYGGYGDDGVVSPPRPSPGGVRPSPDTTRREPRPVDTGRRDTHHEYGKKDDKVVDITRTPIQIIHTHILSDAQIVCDYLRKGETVIFTVTEVTDKGLAQRICDFACGVGCAFDCAYEQIEPTVHMFAPKGTPINNDMRKRAEAAVRSAFAGRK